MAGEEQLRQLEEKYEGYTVYDSAGEKIGKVDEIFVDDTDREEYIGVKMGLLGMSGSTLVPMEIVRVDEQGRSIEVSETKDRVKDAPAYNNDEEVDEAYEGRIRSYFGLDRGQSSGERGSYAGYPDRDRDTGGTARSDYPDREGSGDRGEDGEGEGEARMQRGDREDRGEHEDREEHEDRGESGEGERLEREPRDEVEDREPGTERHEEESVREDGGGRTRVRRRHSRQARSSSFEEDVEEEERIQ